MRTLIISSAGSPFARKVRIVLHEKGISYDEVIRPGIRPVEELRHLNPGLALPVYQDGGETFFGSDLIIEYLLAAYPEMATSGMPPFANRLTRPEDHWGDRKILEIIETFADTMVNVRHFQSEGMRDDASPYLTRQVARLESCLDWLESRATAEGFWPGTFSMMDIALISPLHYAETRRVIQWRDRPTLVALYNFWQSRPSVEATAEPPFKAKTDS